MPVETRSEHQTERHAANVGDGEGGHYQAHCLPAPMLWYDVAHDGEEQRAGNASKSPGERAGSHEHLVCLSEGAEKGSQSEPAIESEESALSVEAVEKKAGGNARNTSADSVGGNDDAKLRRGNREDSHVLRPQSCGLGRQERTWLALHE